MIILCKSCHEKHGEEISDLIKKNSFSNRNINSSLNEQIALLRMENSELREKLDIVVRNQHIYALGHILELNRNIGKEHEKTSKMDNSCCTGGGCYRCY